MRELVTTITPGWVSILIMTIYSFLQSRFDTLWFQVYVHPYPIERDCLSFQMLCVQVQQYDTVFGVVAGEGLNDYFAIGILTNQNGRCILVVYDCNPYKPVDKDGDILPNLTHTQNLLMHEIRAYFLLVQIWCNVEDAYSGEGMGSYCAVRWIRYCMQLGKF